MPKHLGLQQNNIFLETHLKILKKLINKTFKSVQIVLTIVLFLSASLAWAADGRVIPLPDELREALAPLGEGVVGKALPAPVIHDPAKALALWVGAFEYQFIEGHKHAGKTCNEVYSKLSPKNGNPLWSRNIGETLVEVIELKPDSSILITTEISKEHGYGVHFDPGLTVAKKVTPGDCWEVESKLTIFDVKTPNETAYHGTMSAKRSYLGTYELTTPAGRFDAYLFGQDYQIEVGPVKVRDHRYSFFSPGVGKVAEVEGLRVSAILVINIRRATAKLLSSYPKGATPQP